MMLDGLNPKGSRDMGLARSRTTDQDHVLSAVHELTAVQGPYRGLVDLAGGAIKTRKIFVGREAARTV